MAGFYDLFAFYFTEDNPPVMVSKTTGEIVRHGGSQGRSAFWAGYDLLEGGIYGKTMNRKTAAGSAYYAGRAYRRAVDAGQRDPLPEPSQGCTRTGTPWRGK